MLIEEPEWHLVVKVPDQTGLSNPNEQPVVPESRLRVCLAYMPWTVDAQNAVLPNASKCKSAVKRARFGSFECHGAMLKVSGGVKDRWRNA